MPLWVLKIQNDRKSNMADFNGSGCIWIKMTQVFGRKEHNPRTNGSKVTTRNVPWNVACWWHYTDGWIDPKFDIWILLTVFYQCAKLNQNPLRSSMGYPSPPGRNNNNTSQLHFFFFPDRVYFFFVCSFSCYFFVYAWERERVSVCLPTMQ